MIPSPLAALLLTMAIVLVALAYVGQDSGRRRTATAPAEITGIEVRPKVFRGSPPDSVIHYRFVAAGQVLDRIATRTWGEAVIRAAKVCYEPADPSNQVLVTQATSCP